MSSNIIIEEDGDAVKSRGMCVRSEHSGGLEEESSASSVSQLVLSSHTNSIKSACNEEIIYFLRL